MGTVNQIAGQNQSALERTVLVQHLTAATALVPAVGDPAAPLVTGGLSYEHNDTSWDPVRNNVEATVFASATRSATVTSAALTNFNSQGAMFFLNITSVPASGSATVALILQGQDPVSLAWASLGFTSQQVSAGTTVVTYHPGISASANGAAGVLPRTFRVLAAVSAGATVKDVVFSVGMSFVK